jgi:hypothetical protein
LVDFGRTLVAKMRLDVGFMRVRPLLGGLDARVAVGYLVELNDPLQTFYRSAE